MNKSKFGRHIGVGRNWHGDLPPITMNLPLDRMAGAAVQGACGAGIGIGGQTMTLIIDPPAGGFAAGDVLAQFPRSDPAVLVNAVETPNLGRLFAAGHYLLTQQAQTPPAAGKGYYADIYVVRNGVISPLNGIGPPHWLFRCQATTDYQAKWFESRIYMPEAWMMVLSAQTALADADIGWYYFDASPIHLLDDSPAHS